MVSKIVSINSNIENIEKLTIGGYKICQKLELKEEWHMKEARGLYSTGIGSTLGSYSISGDIFAHKENEKELLEKLQYLSFRGGDLANITIETPTKKLEGNLLMEGVNIEVIKGEYTKVTINGHFNTHSKQIKEQ